MKTRLTAEWQLSKRRNSASLTLHPTPSPKPPPLSTYKPLRPYFTRCPPTSYPPLSLVFSNRFDPFRRTHTGHLIVPIHLQPNYHPRISFVAGNWLDNSNWFEFLFARHERCLHEMNYLFFLSPLYSPPSFLFFSPTDDCGIIARTILFREPNSVYNSVYNFENIIIHKALPHK